MFRLYLLMYVYIFCTSISTRIILLETCIHDSLRTCVKLDFRHYEWIAIVWIFGVLWDFATFCAIIKFPFSSIWS